MLPQGRGWAQAVLRWNGFISLGWVNSHAWKSWLGWLSRRDAGKGILSRLSWARPTLRPLLRVSEFMKMPIRQNKALNGANAASQL